MTPKLSPGRLYFGDNGRTFCGSIQCAGMTAHYTGRDLSGHPVAMATPNDAIEHDAILARDYSGPYFPLACEGCGKVATRFVATDGGAVLGKLVPLVRS